MTITASLLRLLVGHHRAVAGIAHRSRRGDLRCPPINLLSASAARRDVRRGLRLADEVVDFLLRHGRRDLASLLAVLDALDRASLERKRPVTVPLLKEMLNNFNRTPKSS